MDAVRINDLISQARERVTLWDKKPVRTLGMPVTAETLIRALAALPMVVVGERATAGVQLDTEVFSSAMRRMTVLPEQRDDQVIVALVMAIKGLTSALARRTGSS